MRSNVGSCQLYGFRFCNTKKGAAGQRKPHDLRWTSLNSRARKWRVICSSIASRMYYGITHKRCSCYEFCSSSGLQKYMLLFAPRQKKKGQCREMSLSEDLIQFIAEKWSLYASSMLNFTKNESVLML